VLVEQRRNTCFGPVVTPVIALGCGAGEDYVLRSPDTLPLARHSIQATIHMMKASNAIEFRERAKSWVRPSMHCVFGDMAGDVGYTPLAAVPLRHMPCDPATGTEAIIGSENGLDWNGFIPYDVLPWTIKSDGFLAIANNRPAGSWYKLPMLLKGASARSTPRWTRLWKFFTLDLPIGQNKYDADSLVESLVFDPVAIHREQFVRRVLHVTAPGSGWPALTHTPSQDLIDWYNDGAKSFESDPRFVEALIVGDGWFLPPGDPRFVELERVFGNGFSGGTALLRHIVSRDLDSPADALDPADLLDAEIVVLVDAMLGVTPPPVTELDLSVTFEHFDSWPDQAPVHPDGQHDVSVDVLCQDKETLWSATGKIYTQVVDLADPNSSGILHPLGNHEDKDDPFLGEHDRDGNVEAWRGNASVPTETVAGMNSTLDRGSLGVPSNLDIVDPADPINPPVSGEPVVPPYTPPLSEHFGSGYAGWDPKRALALELVSHGTAEEVRPGDVVTVAVHGAQDGTNWRLRVGTVKTNALVDAVNRNYVDVMCVYVPPPPSREGILGGHYSCQIVEHFDGDGDGVFVDVPIPSTVESEFVYFQAYADSLGGGYEPLATVSTSGLSVRMTYP